MKKTLKEVSEEKYSIAEWRSSLHPQIIEQREAFVKGAKWQQSQTWTHIDDEKPPFGKLVLAIYCNTHYVLAKLIYGEFGDPKRPYYWNMDDSSRYHYDDIKYWMELPRVPMSDKDKRTLSEVVEKLEGVELFPEANKRAREFLSKIENKDILGTFNLRRETEKYLRDKFKQETHINWINSQDEPDIDYVEWLEKKLINKIIDG